MYVLEGEINGADFRMSRKVVGVMGYSVGSGRVLVQFRLFNLVFKTNVGEDIVQVRRFAFGMALKEYM